MRGIKLLWAEELREKLRELRQNRNIINRKQFIDFMRGVVKIGDSWEAHLAKMFDEDKRRKQKGWDAYEKNLRGMEEKFIREREVILKKIGDLKKGKKED